MANVYVLRPPNPPARRAGTMLLVLGGLALFLGGGLLVVGTHLPALAADEAMRERIDELRRQLSIDPKILFIGYGVMMLAYAAAALTLGALVRAGGQAVLIVTLIAASLVTAICTLAAVATMARGAAGDVILPFIVVGLHAWIIKWTIDGLRLAAAAPRVPIEPRRPMEEYYLSPVMPAGRHVGW